MESRGKRAETRLSFGRSLSLVALLSRHASHIQPAYVFVIAAPALRLHFCMQAHCPECGVPQTVGGPSCREMRDQLLARDMEQPVKYWQYHRLAIDAYCVQHDANVKSAKSLAAHLCGICVAFEHRNDQDAL